MGHIYAPTTIEAMGGILAPMNKALYLEMNGAKDIQRLPRSKVWQLADRYDIVEHLTLDWRLRHSAKFGEIIMGALGISYQISPQGGVVPA
jgi:hypothetical protein